MPRHNISSVYIADGFVDDCEALMKKCSQFGRLNYEKFCDVWKEMQFVRIFHGRQSSAEMAELSEEVLYVAKHYMINKDNSIEESVAGLFLVYALQNLQPYTNFAALRIAPEDVPMIEQLISMARQQRRCDVLFILGSVLIKGPVQYHADQRERGMELSFRKYLEGSTNMNDLTTRRKGVFHRHSDEMEIIKEYHTMTRLYSETKAEICGTTQADRSLNYVNHDFATEIEASFKKLMSGNVDLGDKKSDEETEQQEDIASIKHRAMTNAVSPIKHLTGVQERKEKANKNPDKKNESKVNSKTTKDNTSGSSPTKSISKKLKTTPKKRKAPPKRKTKRRKLRKYDIKSESDEDDVISLPSSDGGTDDDIDLNTLQKEQHLVDIEIDALPMFISTEMEGKHFEIEIIDELKKNNEANKNSNDDCGETSEPADINKKIDDSTVFKVPITDKVKRLERRELKQSILKSKFKRMGVLPVTYYKN